MIPKTFHTSLNNLRVIMGFPCSRNKAWIFRVIETQQQIPTDYLKHLEGTERLYEIKFQQGSVGL